MQAGQRLRRAGDGGVAADAGATWCHRRRAVVAGAGVGDRDLCRHRPRHRPGRWRPVVRDGRAYPLETEGGHVSFPPGTPEEIDILETPVAQFGRVSNERLICGPGLVNLHRALSEIAGEDPGPLQPADVTARAAAGDPRCMRTLDVFCAVFGAIAGDLVLSAGAWDGVSSPADWCRSCCRRCSIPASASASSTRAASRPRWRACRRWPSCIRARACWVRPRSRSKCFGARHQRAPEVLRRLRAAMRHVQCFDGRN